MRLTRQRAREILYWAIAGYCGLHLTMSTEDGEGVPVVATDGVYTATMTVCGGKVLVVIEWLDKAQPSTDKVQEWELTYV